MTPRTSLRWVERILIILGVLLIGLWFRNDTQARAVRSAETKRIAVVHQPGALSDAAAVWPAEEPWCPPRLESGVFGRIELRRLGISALIAEGSGPSVLEHGVGHIKATAFPGQPGNCALVGNRDSFLRGLGEVRGNDVIRIDTLQGDYTYVVEWARVIGPRHIDVLDATGAPSLTLVTRFPFHAIGPAPDRFVVRARLVEPATSDPP